MCCSGPVRQVSSQLMPVLSAPLALAKAVISARCIGTSFVRSFFDPRRRRRPSVAEIQAHSRNMLNRFMYHPTPPPNSHKQPLVPRTIYDRNSCRCLLKRVAAVVLASQTDSCCFLATDRASVRLVWPRRVI